MLSKKFKWNDIKDLVKELSDKLGEDLTHSIKSWCEEHRGLRSNDIWQVYLIKERVCELSVEKAGIIGYYKLSTKTKQSKDDTVWLGWFGVRNKWYGKGIAQKAMLDIIKKIQRYHRNSEYLYLYTEADNYRAIKFYEKMGFEHVSTVSQYCKDHDIAKHEWFTEPKIADDIVMRKRIKRDITVKDCLYKVKRLLYEYELKSLRTRDTVSRSWCNLFTGDLRKLKKEIQNG